MLSLPLPVQAVPGCRADKVLHVLPDPAAALAGAHRVLTPGGRIVLVGQDWDALMIDSSHPDLTRAILHTSVQRHPNDDPSLSDDELVRRRVARFDAYTAQKNVLAPAGESPYTCPCCGHATLLERGGYEICDECGWEDDGQDDHDSATVRGGPNGRLSLDAARAGYAAGGGIRQIHRPPGEPV
ncbi:CPCC family cysteine-rich protein [Micromonospora chersina]|uniref:CPCC family cysteine-rich protein n=1 Tax=Micromonospora chersina TaxID=47854 RepID=UPI0037205A18